MLVVLLTGENVLYLLVEMVLVAVVRRADDNLPAPHQERQSRLQELLQIIDEGCFVDHHHALLATQGTGCG
ncbi:hypothetical protein D3C71_2225010 [compost metagenome]